MLFKDIRTGAKLDVTNEFVIEQYKKHSDRYKVVKSEPKKPEEK